MASRHLHLFTIFFRAINFVELLYVKLGQFSFLHDMFLEMYELFH